MIAADIMTFVAILLMAFAIWEQGKRLENTPGATKTYLMVAVILAGVSLAIKILSD